MISLYDIKPTYQDKKGNPCSKDDENVKYMVVGNIRTNTESPPEILINGKWIVKAE